MTTGLVEESKLHEFLIVFNLLMWQTVQNSDFITRTNNMG